MKPFAIEGSCICGAVEIGLRRVPRAITQCNCSVCRKYGVLWAYYQQEAASIRARRGALSHHEVKAGGLRFVHCKQCGCVIQWIGHTARIGVNARLLAQEILAKLEISVLDGDRTWRVVEHYRKPAMFISPARAPVENARQARSGRGEQAPVT